MSRLVNEPVSPYTVHKEKKRSVLELTILVGPMSMSGMRGALLLCRLCDDEAEGQDWMLRTFFCSGLGFGARDEILTAVVLENKMSYDLTPYQLVKSNRRFGGSYFIFMVEQ